MKYNVYSIDGNGNKYHLASFNDYEDAAIYLGSKRDGYTEKWFLLITNGEIQGSVVKGLGQ